MMFKSLDYLHVPAPDIESWVQYCIQVLGSELLWKIPAYGVRVACISPFKGGKAKGPARRSYTQEICDAHIEGR